MVKPLKDLLAEADALIKSASAQPARSREKPSDEIEKLAHLLMAADAQVSISPQPALSNQAEFEKMAESLNRVCGAAEIDTHFRIRSFEVKAEENGYTPEQIEEALAKVAAREMVSSLPMLAALKGRNSKPSPHGDGSKILPQQLGRVDVTKNTGYEV